MICHDGKNASRNGKIMKFFMHLVDDEITKVKCPHCSFEADYETYLDIMKEKALSMSADYIPDRPGF